MKCKVPERVSARSVNTANGRSARLTLPTETGMLNSVESESLSFGSSLNIFQFAAVESYLWANTRGCSSTTCRIFSFFLMRSM